MTAAGRDRATLGVSAAIALYYAILGLVILAPESLYSGDIGVQYVQAQAILDHKFRSLDITYPGEFLDPDRRFFPIRPPFVFDAAGITQSIFPPASALLQAVGVAAFGLRGMILISVIAAWATLYSAARLAPPRLRVAVLVALGFASPLWFYAVSGWHHAAGMAFGTSAFALAFTATSAAAPVLAGLSLGAGAVLRDEVILLAPGVAAALWIRRRSLMPVAYMGAGALAALACAAAVDVWWFGRPAAAHLRHAVHLLQSALQTTDSANMEVPVLHPMTLQERHQTVIQYWLFGYGNDTIITVYVAGLLAALLVRWKLRSSAGIVAWLLAVLGLVALDFRELMTAPKWLAGLYRVAPYIVFAVMPWPVRRKDDDAGASGLLPRVALIAAAAYLVVAFAGVDTTGGKGLGPRLLLPLLPVLTVAAIIRMRAYLRSDAMLDRLAGGAGALLLIMTLVMHCYATTRAYYWRNRDDSSVVLAVAASPERIVVADEVHTAQLLFAMYYRKIILLADSPEAAQAVGSMIASARLPGALLVSRSVEPTLTLPGLRVKGSEQIGRMSITHWVR